MENKFFITALFTKFNGEDVTVSWTETDPYAVTYREDGAEIRKPLDLEGLKRGLMSSLTRLKNDKKAFSVIDDDGLIVIVGMASVDDIFIDVTDKEETEETEGGEE